MTRFFVVAMVSLIIAPHWPEEALAHGALIKELLTENLISLSLNDAVKK